MHLFCFVLYLLTYFQSLPRRRWKENWHHIKACWDTFLKWGNLGEQNNPHPSPPPHIQSWGCLLFSTGSWNSGTTLHGGGREGKALFFFFKFAKRQRGPLGQSVSTNFVTNIIVDNQGTCENKSCMKKKRPLLLHLKKNNLLPWVNSSVNDQLVPEQWRKHFWTTLLLHATFLPMKKSAVQWQREAETQPRKVSLESPWVFSFFYSILQINNTGTIPRQRAWGH